MRDLTHVLQRPVITEKTTALREEKNKYVFEVAPAANKHEIRRAVEQFFGVKVLEVRTAMVQGKPKRMGRFEGYRSKWKKAVVTLAPDDTIDIFDVV